MKIVIIVVKYAAIFLLTATVFFSVGQQDGKLLGRKETQLLIAEGKLPVSSTPGAPFVVYRAPKGYGRGWAYGCPTPNDQVIIKATQRGNRSQFIDCPT